jgi:FixJ family two-component response regulator
VESQQQVFVVEDDPPMRIALRNLLKSVGLDVLLFACAHEFLEQRRPDVPSCLILDVRLPGLSGLDLQKRLAQANIHTPIIFITGHGDISMSVRAMKLRAVEFLTKPFRDQDLLDGVQLSLSKDQARRQQKGMSPD